MADTKLSDLTLKTGNMVAADLVEITEGGNTTKSVTGTKIINMVTSAAVVTANTAKISYPSSASTKLAGIEASATADQTNDEIKAAVEAASDSNTFTDADHTKLNAIEASADVTDTTNVTAAGALMDSELSDLAGVKGVTISTLQVKPSEGAFANGDKTKLNAIEASADVTDSTNVVAALTAGTGITIASNGTIAAGPLAVTTVQIASSQSAQLALTAEEGDVVVRSDENKSYMHNSGSAGTMDDYTLLATPTDAVLSVNGVTGAVTAAHIATAVEAASGSNTFTDVDHTKLNAIAASANNYVHPNHSGEVTSTADGATVIVDNIVDEANLKVSNTPTNGYALTAQSGNTGGLTWAVAAPIAGSSSIVTTGALNSGSITSGFGTINNGASSITTTGALGSGAATFAGNVTHGSAAYVTLTDYGTSANSRIITGGTNTATGYLAVAQWNGSGYVNTVSFSGSDSATTFAGAATVSGGLNVVGTNNTTSTLLLSNTAGTDNNWSLVPAYNAQTLAINADSTTVLTLNEDTSATFAGPAIVKTSGVPTLAGGSPYGLLVKSGGVNSNGTYQGSIGFTESSGTLVRSAIMSKQTGSDNDQNGLAFMTHPSASNVDGTIALLLEHDMSATFAGEVNVGTTASGDGTLNIIASTGEQSIIEFSDSTNSRGRIYYDHASNPEKLILETTGTTAMSIDNGQNATFAGSSLTHTPSSGGNGQINASRTSGATVHMQAQSALGIVGTSSAHDFKLIANSTTALTLATNLNATFAGNINAVAGGINLGATGAANLLDDYEAGNWTPTIVGSSTAGTYTVTTGSSARYEKVGSLVHVGARLTFSAAGSGGGDAILGGLPFNYASGSLPSGTFLPSAVSLPIGTAGMCAVMLPTSSGAASTMAFTIGSDGAGAATILVTGISTSSTIYINMTYRV